MTERRVTSALVEQFRRGRAALDLRLVAAQGLLPLKSEDLLELWVDLDRDPDERVRAAAARSLSSFPAPDFLSILKSWSTPPTVLAWALTNRPERELREAALQNPSTTDETIEALAPTLSQALAELVVISQTRLLRRTSLLVALETNAGLSNNQKRRLRELRETFRIGEVEAAPPPAPEAPPAPAAPEPQAEPEIAPLGDVFLTEGEYTVKILSEEERQQTEKVSAVQKIYRLNTAEKLITALKGSREERAILIRDPSRLVSAAALDSPRLTEVEVESFCAMEDVSDQVLRYIGNHREWTKRYKVVANLVKNPSTPLDISLQLASQLSPRDVNRIAPEAVRKAARAVRRHRGGFSATETESEPPEEDVPGAPTWSRRTLSKMIGIDLGTMKSCVAAMEGGAPRVIPNQEGENTTPSVVAFTANGERLVGGPASRQALTNPDGTVHAVMRVIGRRFSSKEVADARRFISCPLVEGRDGDVRVRIQDKVYSTTEILSFLLSDLKVAAEDSLGEPLEEAVISCPATFYDPQRRAVKDAGFMAGFKTVSLVNATTAAALAYRAGKKARPGLVVAVFHLGGGTFDISIVEFAGGLCKVRGRAGDSFLGGEDFDQRIVDWLIAQSGRDFGMDFRPDGMALRRIKDAAERAKCELSAAQQTRISLPFLHTDPSGPKHLTARLTRDHYEALTRDLVERMVEPCRRCLADSGLGADQIDEVLLVGSQTRAPRVGQLVHRLFGHTPSRVVDPETGIAVGAAFQASRLAREQQDDTLLDVTPHTLGIEGEDGTFVRIIERNSTIPTHRRRVLITDTDYQTQMKVHLLQGERDSAAENESLGQLEFAGIPSAPAGEAYIEVDFDIDEDGIVSVELLGQGTAEPQPEAETHPAGGFHGPMIAIDFGTTNSCVAVMEGGVPQVIPDQTGGRTTPSVVAFSAEGERLVGPMAKRQMVTNAEATVTAVKRLMGRKFDSPEVARAREVLPYEVVRAANGDVHIKVEGTVYSPPEIASFVFQRLKSAAEDYLGVAVEAAIITVPAYFDDLQRQATKDAAAIAGFNVVRIINEPTAAALAHGLKNTPRGDGHLLAVYDLGGGTFDITILEVFRCGLFEVRATAGDTFLGGEDFDQRIIDWLIDEFRRETGIDLRRDRMPLQRLKEVAERAKCELSTVPQTEVVLPYISADASGPKHLNTVLTREEYEELTEDLLQRTIDSCRKCLADAGLEAEQVDEVLLVGGQTRAPRVSEVVKKLFKREPNRGINPDEDVARGAAIQAGITLGEVDLASFDVTPHTLGIETRDGTFTPLIERNSTIPTRKSRVFTTVADNQTRIEVHVLQGESDVAARNRSLAKFELTNISPAPKGVPQIEVTFEIDVNGIVSVGARDQGTGRAQGIVVHPSAGLSPAEVTRMTAETLARVVEEKPLQKQGVARQIDGLVANMTRSVQALGGKLTAAERERILESIKKAKEARLGSPLEELRARLADLEKVSGIIGQAMLRQ